MDAKKVIAVVEVYEKRLREKGVPKIRMDPKRTFASLNKAEILAHAHFQCDEVRKYAGEGWDKWGKAKNSTKKLLNTAYLWESRTIKLISVPSLINGKDN
jgi:hypothetical protein